MSKIDFFFSNGSVFQCLIFRGAKNINKSIGDHFNNSVLNSLLVIMDQIKQIKSAAGLHWLFVLLLKVTKKDNEQVVTNKCVSLLKEVRLIFKYVYLLF